MLVGLLRKLSIEDIRKIEEKFDKQFKALKNLYENTRDENSFPLLVVLNALVSYQLNVTGELYWWEFAKYFSNREIGDEIGAMKHFLRSSKGNKRFINMKIRRLEKIAGYKNFIKENYKNFYENMVSFRDFLSKIMKQDKNAKTIVFAVKMFGYAMRIYTKKFIPYPFEIAIPLDVRIKKITEKFTTGEPAEFWFSVAKKVKIPPLHIDSVLWNLYKNDSEKLKTLLPEKFEILERIKNIIR